jgi:hypothetical protein
MILSMSRTCSNSGVYAEFGDDFARQLFEALALGAAGAEDLDQHGVLLSR